MSALFRLAAGICLFHLAFLPPGNFCVDGNSMLAVTESLLREGSVTVPEHLGRMGVDGRWYSIWYPLQSILFLPFAAAGHFAGNLFHLPGHYLAAVCCLLLPVMLTGMTTALVFSLALGLGAGAAEAWLAAVGLAFGTVSMTYARTLFADPLLGLITVLGFAAAFRKGPPRIGILGGLSALSLLAKPAGILLGPVLAFYLYFRHRTLRPALAPAAGSVIGFCLYALYNRHRFGNFLDFGQASNFSIASVPEGLLGLAASPGRGLFWYSPAAALGLAGLFALRKKMPLEYRALALFCGLLVILHALWAQWHGGWSWGSRLLLPLLPLFLAAAAPVLSVLKKTFVALLVAGFLINAPTLAWFYQHYSAEAHARGATEGRLLWSPAEMPALGAWPAAAKQIKEASRYDVGEVLETAGKSDGENETFKVVALWWWMAPAAGLPRLTGALLAAAMAASGLWLVWKARPPLKNYFLK